MTLALADLLQEPSLPEYHARIGAHLDQERGRRERFYDAIADEKSEFINGEIIMHSPALDRHLVSKDNLQRVLGTFCDLHALGLVRGEKALCVFPRNDYEPDVCFFGLQKAATIQPTTLKFPVPDFACEILSDSTARRDRGVKFRDYAAQGVGEYWIVDAELEVLEQYLLRGGEYELALKSGSGEVASPVIAGFRLPIRALFDPQENLRVLREVVLGESGQ